MFRGLLLALTVLLTLVPTVAAENCTTTVATAAPDTMYPNAWLTVASIIAMLIALSVGIIDCAPAMVVTTTFLYLCGVISITDLLAGLSNTSVITIALLFICVDPIAELPLVKKVVSLCLKGGAGTRMPLFKIVLMCLLTSSFLNNAPQVAMLTTMIKFYCRENKLYPSQLLMPMNFATLCGNYAIIGTSTNLIVDGLMQKYGLGPMPFFELIKINGPFTIVMLAYLVFMPKYLLPYRTGLARAKVKDTKAVVLVLARVLETSSLINHTVQEMVVRAAAEAPLAVLQIKRWPDAGVERSHAPFEPSGRSFSGNPTPINGSFFDPTQPRVFFPLTGDEVIQAGDFLTLQTTAEELTGLAAPFGLQWSTMQIAGSPRARDGGDFEMEVEVDDKTHDAADTRQILPAIETMPQGPATAGLVAVNQDHTEFFEVVVSQRCPLVGEHIGSGAFARRYRASPVSLRRLEHDDVTTGETLAEHALQAGDTLLLLANTTFGVAWKDTKEFLVINPIVNPTAEDEVEPVRFYLPNCFPCGNPVGDKDEDRKKEIVLPVWFNYIMVLIFLTMISCAIAGYDLTTCALLAVIAIVTLGIITAERAISLIEMEVLIMVAFSFGLGSAMEKSGFAAFLGGQLKAAHVSGIGLLYLIAVLTTIMTNVITNKACVQVLVPLIVAIYHQQGKCALPPVMMCCALASMALSTPQGFATNLMVMGPGGYQPFDFIKFGLPLNLLGTAIIPLITAGVYQMEW